MPGHTTRETITYRGESAARPGALQVGRVLECTDDGTAILVDVDGELCQAQLAFGCLVRPIVEDRVLVAIGADDAFVLSVLERSGPNYATLALPGRGNLVIEGETLALTANQRLTLRAAASDIRTKALTIFAERTSWLGKLFTAVVERWRSSAKTQEVSADTLTIRAIDRSALIDRVDTVQAATQVAKISGVSTEMAQSKVIAVTDDLRIDGKRVTVG